MSNCINFLYKKSYTKKDIYQITEETYPYIIIEDEACSYMKNVNYYLLKFSPVDGYLIWTCNSFLKKDSQSKEKFIKKLVKKHM